MKRKVSRKKYEEEGEQKINMKRKASRR